MRTTNYDAIAASHPLNTTAAVVRDGLGEQWDAEVPAHHLYWTSPPPMKSPPAGAKPLVGRSWGRLQVVGYFCHSKSAGSKWVVRCACGGFEVRRSKAAQTASPDDMCVKCYRGELLKKRARAIARGRNEDGSPLKAGLNTKSGSLTLKDMGVVR